MTTEERVQHILDIISARKAESEDKAAALNLFGIQEPDEPTGE